MEAIMAVSQAIRSHHSAQSRAPQPASPNPASASTPNPPALSPINVLDSSLKKEASSRIERMGKRTTSITVKMSAEDYELLEKAADAIWPGAVLSRSSIVLGLG